MFSDPVFLIAAAVVVLTAVWMYASQSKGEKLTILPVGRPVVQDGAKELSHPQALAIARELAKDGDKAVIARVKSMTVPLEYRSSWDELERDSALPPRGDLSA